MLSIRCPWCGERDETEFRCHGEAHIERPADAASLSDEQWGDYLFFRANPRGWHRERWTHDYGCRRWFYALRHTGTGEIAATYAPTDPKPGAPEPESAAAAPAPAAPAEAAK